MKEKIKRFCGTLAVFALLVSLVCLSFVYMFSFRTSDKTKFDADDMQALAQNFTAAGYMDHVDVKNILPVFVGASLADGEMRVGTFGGDTLENMYEDCFEVAWQFLAQGRAQMLSDESTQDYIRMAKNGAFIYIKYAAAYPKSVIVSFTRKDTFTLNISDEYIKEIFVFNNTYTGSVCLLTVCDNGKNYVYTGEFGFDGNFNKNIINEYNNAEGAFVFSFSSEKENDVFISEEKFADTVYGNAVIAEEEIFIQGIIFESVSRRLDMYASYDSLLSLFTLNPEKISVFTENDGTRTFFEEGQNVSITKDGAVTYSAVGTGGMYIGSVIGYSSENSEYSLRDKIGATLCIANELAQAMRLSKDIGIKLSGINYDENGNLVITYSVSFCGITVICDEAFFSFTIAGNKIKGVVCNMFDATAYSETRLPNATWELIGYAVSAETDTCVSLVPAYLYAAEGENVFAHYFIAPEYEEAEK